MVIGSIDDLEKRLWEAFCDEPAVHPHIVTGECPGDTVAVEVIPESTGEKPWVAFVGLTTDDQGCVDGIQGTAYDGWDPDNSSPQWWASECGMYLGWLPAQDSAGNFAKVEFDRYMTNAFGGLYHSEAVAGD